MFIVQRSEHGTSVTVPDGAPDEWSWDYLFSTDNGRTFQQMGIVGTAHVRVILSTSLDHGYVRKFVMAQCPGCDQPKHLGESCGQRVKLPVIHD